MFTKYARGMVYWCNLPKYAYNTNVQSGRRPVIIISNNVGNIFSKNVIIVPCTTNIDKKPEQPTHIKVKLAEYSIVLCENILTISKELLNEFMGILDNSVMDEIDKRIKVALGLSDAGDITYTNDNEYEDITNDKNKKDVEPIKPKKNNSTTVKRGIKLSTIEDMKDFLEFFNTHSREETAEKYEIPNIGALMQRVNYYKRKIK